MLLIWKILSNERGQSPWASGFGGLMQGLAQGFQLREDHERKKELLKLEQARIKLAEQEANLKGEAFKQAVTQHAAANDFADQLANAGQPAQAPQADYQMGGQFSSVQPENKGLKRSMIGTPPMGSQQLMAGLIKSGQGAHLGGLLTQQAGQADMEKQLQLMQRYGLIGQGSSGTPVQMIPSMGNKGMTLRGHVHDPGVGTDSQLWDRIVSENPGADTGNLRDIYNREKGKTSNVTSREGKMGGYQAENTPQAYTGAENRSSGTSAGHPLENSTQQAVGAMQQASQVAKSIKQEFTPDELNKYVGFFKFPANRISQFAQGDPKFARFQALINQVKGTAFSEGGKQLTPFEAGITFGHIPTGTEFSTADFVAKLDNTIDQTDKLVQQRFTLAKTPRGKITPESGPLGLKPAPGAKPAASSKEERLRALGFQ